MAQNMNGRDWYEMITKMNEQAHICYKSSGNTIKPHDVQSVLGVSNDTLKTIMQLTTIAIGNASCCIETQAWLILIH
jgi:hypothetical protein